MVLTKEKESVRNSKNIVKEFLSFSGLFVGTSAEKIGGDTAGCYNTTRSLVNNTVGELIQDTYYDWVKSVKEGNLAYADLNAILIAEDVEAFINYVDTRSD